MTPLATAACAAVAAIAGALNAVAGGGSFLLFPAILAAGVAPIDANVATTLALWPASISSTLAYRRELGAHLRLGAILGVVSLLGSLAGARALLATPDARFVRIVPFMLLGATALFTAGPALTKRLGTPSRARGRVAAALAFQALVAAYGGYFGGGLGIIVLAVLGVILVDTLTRLNALKQVTSLVVNAVAAGVFVLFGDVVWSAAAVMLVCAVVGGFLGGTLASRVPARVLQRIVVVIGVAVAIGYAVTMAT